MSFLLDHKRLINLQFDTVNSARRFLFLRCLSHDSHGIASTLKMTESEQSEVPRIKNPNPMTTLLEGLFSRNTNVLVKKVIQKVAAFTTVDATAIFVEGKA